MGAESSKLLLLEALPAVVGSLGAWWGVFIGRGRPEEGMGDRPFLVPAACALPCPLPLKKKTVRIFMHLGLLRSMYPASGIACVGTFPSSFLCLLVVHVLPYCI